MQEDLRNQFLDDLNRQLNHLYQDLKLKRKFDERKKHRLEGFMHAGTCLGLTDKAELEMLMEKAHFSVFGMSIAERRLKSLKDEQDEVDWSFYDTPTTQRLKEGE